METLPLTRKDGVAAARTYLARDCEITAAGDDALVARRRPEHAANSAGRPYPDQETAALVVDEITIGNGTARARYLRAVEWKRAADGRALALFHPRDINSALLREFSECVVHVAYPLVSFRTAWDVSAAAE